MDQGKNVSPQWAPRRPLHRLRVRPQRREQHLPVRSRRERRLPAHRLLHRQPRASRRSRRCSPGRGRPTGWPSCTSRQGKYDVYTLSNPRSLKRQPYQRAGAGQQRPAGQHAVTAAARHHAGRCRCRRRCGPRSAKGGSIYRTPSGFRSSSEVGRTGDTAVRGPAGLHRGAARLGQLQPARHERVHRQAVPGQLHARLRGPALHRLRPRQLRARILRRHRRSR